MGMCNCNGSCNSGGGCGGAGPQVGPQPVGLNPMGVGDKYYQPPYDTSGAPNPYYPNGGYYYPNFHPYYNPWAPWQGYPPCGGCLCRGWQPPYWNGLPYWQGMAVAQGGVPAAMGTYGQFSNASGVVLNETGPVTTGVVEVDSTKVDPNVSFYTKL